MPDDYFEFLIEFVDRQTSVPYYNGHGRVRTTLMKDTMKKHMNVSTWIRSGLVAFFAIAVSAAVAGVGCGSQSEGSSCNPALSHDECSGGLQCMQPYNAATTSPPLVPAGTVMPLQDPSGIASSVTCSGGPCNPCFDQSYCCAGTQNADGSWDITSTDPNCQWLVACQQFAVAQFGDVGTTPAVGTSEGGADAGGG